MSYEKIKDIKIVIVDVDGVMTDGTITFGNFADEYRSFNVHDGFGFVLLHKAGLRSAIITSKSSKGIMKRAKELKISIVFRNVERKLDALNKIIKKYHFKKEEICYIGDDILDLGVIKNVGFSATVPEASEEIKNNANYISKKNAGKGAIREVIELILKTQGKWNEVLKQYL